MYIEQIYTGCISEAAYYIESKGESAIIDPLRDIEQYLHLAKERNTTIKYIFETHFHADFVSGHLDLAKATGATIIYGPTTETNLPVYVAKDKETFNLGEVTFEVLHTPGHTLESSCYLLKTVDGKDYALFTGDTLFIGDVGRPDLAQKGELTINDLAGLMYESLQNKIMPLDDNILVYPGHGAGSSCGKNLGPETYSLLGEQKKSNYALLQPNKEAFIKAITQGLTAPPNYFPINAKINKEGYKDLDIVVEQGLKELSLEHFQELSNLPDSIILDTRNVTLFKEGFVPGAIFIGLEGRFAEWAGALLPYDKNLVLVTEIGKEKETIIRLARVGFEKIIGCLSGGFETWKNTGNTYDLIIDVEPDELAMDIPFDKNLLVVDVRNPTEFANGHIVNAINLPLSDLVDPASMAMFDDHFNLYIHCAGGYRSVIAASLIKAQGIHNLRNINGGYTKITALEDSFEFEKSPEVLN